MKNYDTIIVGSGVTGIIAAYVSAKSGNKVILIERNPNLGGIMRGFTWENTHFDFGCHLFGNDQNETTTYIQEIMDDELSPLHPSVASLYQGRVTKGFELPDLTELPREKKDAFLREAGQAITASESLEAWLKARYGNTIFPTLDECVQKMFLKSSAELSAEAAPPTPFRRLRLFEDDEARQLKADPKWDDLIAAAPLPTPIPRAFYPKKTGISHFIYKAEEKLRALGVDLKTSCQITDVQRDGENFSITTANETFNGNQLVWTAGLVNLVQSTAEAVSQTVDIESQIHRVPMVLFYYIFSKENEGDLDYFHCFDRDEPFFRMSVPGRYGDRNCQDGESYLCVEVPTEIGSSTWNRPETQFATLWEKAWRYGLVRSHSTYLKATHKKTPVSYKLPLLGYHQASKPLLEFAEENGIILGNEWAFTKGGLITKILSQVERKKAA